MSVVLLYPLISVTSPALNKLNEKKRSTQRATLTARGKLADQLFSARRSERRGRERERGEKVIALKSRSESGP